MDALTELQPKKTAHTLFLDFVGYSRLPASAQAQVQQLLHNLAYATQPMQKTRSREELIVRRTGDGMAMIFFDDLEAPLNVALQLDEQLKRQQTRLREQLGGTQFRLRMGVHSGPVIVLEENGELDVAGEGINVAQRVMDAGDAGHILISDVVARALGESDAWKSLFDDLGMCRVKHDELVHLYNVHGAREDSTPIGNEALPPRVRMSQENVQQLVERDAERAKENNSQIARSFVSRAALLLGFLVALTTFAVFLANGIRKSGEATRRAQQIVIARAKKARRDKPDPTTDPATAPSPDPAASPEAPGGPAAALTGSADAQIPDLVGLPQSQAQEKVAAAGLKFALSQKNPGQPSLTVAKDSVVAQFPPSGQRAGADGTVYVTLSLGPEVGGASAQDALTGVVIDVRSQTGFLPGANVFLAGPDGRSIPVRFQLAADEAGAARIAGRVPLLITPTGITSTGGILISAEDQAKLSALPADILSRLAVLHN